jgi:SpoVK/Ycf46/Vps4 family AAA+-type ATPase
VCPPDVDDHLDANYADFFRVGHNAFEFVLDFGRRLPESGREVFHTRIVTSPEDLDRFLETVIGAADQWRSAAWAGSEMSQQPIRLSTTRAASLLDVLARLDELLRHAYRRAREVFEHEEAGEARSLAYRGLHIGNEEAGRLAAQAPATPVISATADDPSRLEGFAAVSLWSPLSERFGFTAFEHAAAALALAPELDLRYERLYAYLQDDVTRRRPTVSLALDILCPNAQAKIEWRNRFAPGAPLLRSGLVRLVPDPAQVNPSWLDYYLVLDDQAVAHVLGDAGLSTRLASFCGLIAPGVGKRLDGEALHGLLQLIVAARADSRNFPICFHGPRGTRQREVAEALAAAAAAPLLAADAFTGIASVENPEANIRALYLDAALRNAIVFVDRVDALGGDISGARLTSLLNAAGAYPGITILCAGRPFVDAEIVPRGILNVAFTLPDFETRRATWQTQLQAAGIPESPQSIEVLAGRFQLTQDQIAEAVAEARSRVNWKLAAAPGTPIDQQVWEGEVMAAARAQTGQDLATLALKVKPVYEWKDLVLPADAEAQLHEICDRVAQRHRVLDQWGFAQKLSSSKGVSVLFTGPTGSGKTMAAEVIANALGIDMYKIDLSGVVSKYIGETEKNLERIFSSAERTNAILFFDEADALFGKRSEVHDSHDRYANIEISYLLQRMEQYDGIAILATNLRGNLDEAFVRRLTYAVRFPLPEQAERMRIWQQIWPSPDLLAPDMDLERLAANFKLSGGNIRNVALSASFFAAADATKITVEHLARALVREYEKVGKNTTTAEVMATLAPAGAKK